MRPEDLHRALAVRGRRQHSRNPRVGTSDPVRTGSCAQSLSNFPAVLSFAAGAFPLCSDGSPEGDIYPVCAPAQRVGFLSAATKDQHHVPHCPSAVVADAAAHLSPRVLAMPGARDAGSAWIDQRPIGGATAGQGDRYGAARMKGINQRRGTASPRLFRLPSGGAPSPKAHEGPATGRKLQDCGSAGAPPERGNSICARLQPPLSRYGWLPRWQSTGPCRARPIARNVKRANSRAPAQRASVLPGCRPHPRWPVASIMKGDHP